MVFVRNIITLLSVLLVVILFSACRKLDKEGPATAIVSIKVSKSQTSSRMAGISRSFTTDDTELIALVTDDTSFNQQYLSLENRYQFALTDLSTHTVTLTVPLDTGIKLYSYAYFDEIFTQSELENTAMQADQFGETSSFTISSGDTSKDVYLTIIDTTAPTASVTPDNITSSGNANVQSTETGKAYLVNTAVTVSNLGNISGAADNQTNSVTISLANTDTMLSATGLVTGTYKVYAVDASGNLSGASADNVTIAGLVDIDGNGYSTVVIGTQHWMAENLKVTKYRNGVDITNITTNAAWNSNTSGAYGVYGNDEPTYLNSNGRLYNWYAVDNSSSRYICPEGWHVPTNDEFDVLEAYLGGVSVAGGKMKEAGTEHWNSVNSGASNSSGFTARGSGYRNSSNGTYAGVKQHTYFWTASQSNSNSNNATYHYILYNSSTIIINNLSKTYGFSVRCLED